MNNTGKLREHGQSIWLDNITREILDDGTLERLIREFNVTGLTSNPSIFEKAITGGNYYDSAIAALVDKELSGEDIFFALALQDLTRATDFFRPVYDATHGTDGFASLEVSPLLADDTEATINSAETLFRKAGRPNLFIKIPGTPAGIPAIEEAIYRGIPINVTLLFSREQYLASAEAWLRGIERRIAEGKSADIASVASVFISRWDVAVSHNAPDSLKNTLGIAIAQRTYKAYVDLGNSERWHKVIAAGASPQKLLWASTGTKDPSASDTLYIEALAAPETINTIPDKTIYAFADHGNVTAPMPTDGGNCEDVIARFNALGVNDSALAEKLQREGAEAFVKSWHDLLHRIGEKAAAVASHSTN